MLDFYTVEKFENLVSNFFGARYGIATDSCTHAIELCMRHDNVNNTFCPPHTYLSIPMTLIKLNIDWVWDNCRWKNYYYFKETRIIDAAVLWEKNSYIPGTLMCLSFQFKKHLSLGRGGMILTDDFESYHTLKEMRYDGRGDLNKPWSEQQIKQIGYHYYMTPESADLGIQNFYKVKDIEPRKWSYLDYPDLSKFEVFN